MTTVMYYNTTTSLASRSLATVSTTETSLKPVPSRNVRDVSDHINLEIYAGRQCGPIGPPNSEATSKANIGLTVGRILKNFPTNTQSNRMQPIEHSDENGSIHLFSKLFLIIYFFQ